MINKLNFLYIIFFTIILILPNNLLASSDNGVSVFMYHRIGDPRYPSTNVSIEQLKSQILEAKKNQYNIMNASEVVKFINDGIDFKKNSIAFTIDDAYESFFVNGWPLFRDNNIPVTLFASTDVIDFALPGYMNWDQIRQFLKEGGTIGQHSASHMSLPVYDESKVESDILRSQQRLKKELGFIPELFAYPYGESSEKIISILKKLNIESAFGQHSGVISQTTNKYYMPRFSINENFGNIERFIFASSSKPLAVKNIKPSDMFVKDSDQLKFKFDIVKSEMANNLQCFANPKNKWIPINLIKNEKTISFDDQYTFEKGRRRINCTVKFQDEWYWFGYQLLIK